MMYRTNVAFMLRIALDLTTLLTGTGILASSQKYLKEDKQRNEDFADANFEIFSNLMIAFEIGRILLFVASYKWLGVTKAVLYVQLAYALIPEIGLPHDRGVYRAEFLRVNLLV